MKRYFLFLLLPFFCHQLEAQNSLQKERADSLFTCLDQNHKIMGSIAVRKGDELLYTRAIGNSCGEPEIKADADTRYRIGSISKMFTATMIMQLIEEKKLSLDTKLSQFFPGVKNAKKISIEHLLTHRSGIHNFTDDSLYYTFYTLPKTHEEMVKIISHYPSDFEPGAKAEYSNSNFVLLGYIIEKITKKDFATNLQERICNRIGLKNTYFGKSTDPQNHESYSFSWDGENWEKVKETDMSIPHGAGSVVSTPTDLTLFIRALFTGKLITQASLDEMTKTDDQKYGKGIFAIPFFEEKGLGHTGGIDEFSSMLVYFPEEELAVAFCSNASNYGVKSTVKGVLSMYYGMPYELPVFKTVKVEQDVLKKYEGRFSMAGVPLKITIRLQKNLLTAQADGQGEFPLEPVSQTEFHFDAAGVIINFTADGNAFTFRQSGTTLIMTKEK